MNEKLTLTLLVTFAILIGASSFSLAMAISQGKSNLGGTPATDCADLDADLQILLENGIISTSDVRDVLFIFNCENI